jgi:hypothetical protein
VRGSLEVPMSELIAERSLDSESAARTDARNALQASVMGGLFQLLERIDIEFVVNPGGEFRPDAWYGSKQLFRFSAPDRRSSWFQLPVVTISTIAAPIPRPMPGSSMTPSRPSVRTISSTSSLQLSLSRTVRGSERELYREKRHEPLDTIRVDYRTPLP